MGEAWIGFHQIGLPGLRVQDEQVIVGEFERRQGGLGQRAVQVFIVDALRGGMGADAGDG